MRVMLGCPVADRAWVLEDWFDRLAVQDQHLDGLLFVHGGEVGDATHQALLAGADRLGVETKVFHDHGRPRTRMENERFHWLAYLRNVLLSMAVAAGADVLISLDSDILLAEQSTLSTLVHTVSHDGWDTASPITWLHPRGPETWAVNAGIWTGPAEDGERRHWARPDPALGAQRIDIPMAASAFGPRVLHGCRYRWHESGEDLGLGLDLERIGAGCVWLPELPAYHAWGPVELPETVAHVQSRLTRGRGH